MLERGLEMRIAKLQIELKDEHEHRRVKMCCARLGISIKDFGAQLIMARVGEIEKMWKEEEDRK